MIRIDFEKDYYNYRAGTVLEVSKARIKEKRKKAVEIILKELLKEDKRGVKERGNGNFCMY